MPGFARQLDDAYFLKANRTIIELDMDCNKIGDAGATALASALQVTPVMRGPRVHSTCSRGLDVHIPSCMWHGFALAQRKNLNMFGCESLARAHVALSMIRFDQARHQNTRHDAAQHGTVRHIMT